MNNCDCMFCQNGQCVQTIDHDGKAEKVKLGKCLYDRPDDRITKCSLSVVDVAFDKTSSIEKRAAWADVKAKAEAIVATGGVVIQRDDSDEVDATVMSAQVADKFPVSKGGPYDVVLARRGWTKSPNYGGWIQGYLCDCEWAKYHDGNPGFGSRDGWTGRMCSHAYATLIESKARARKEFFGDRVASMQIFSDRGFCSNCGKFGERDVMNDLCPDCFKELAFNATVARLYSLDEDERLEAVDFLETCVPESMQKEIADNLEEIDFDEIKCVTDGEHRAALSIATKNKHGYNKSATRIFSLQEQKALQDEALGHLARNRDRFKGEDTSLY